MKKNYICLTLLLAFLLCAEGVEAQSRFKQLFQRNDPERRERRVKITKVVKPDSTFMADSALLSRVVEVQPAVEKADSVAAPEPEKAEARPYNPYLNLHLTPAVMDSLVASWNESQSALAFDKFFADYIAIDSLPAGSTSLPDSVYESRLRALASPIQLPYNPIVKNYINRYTDTRYGTINRIMSLSQYYFPIIEEEL